MLGGIFLLKSLGVLAIPLMLTYGGCQLKKFVLAKERLATISKENVRLKTELAKQRQAVDIAVTDALDKCAAGKKLDAMKKQYKLDAKNCRALLRKKAKDIANQSKKLVQ